jgi:LIVCS family branched-chain amino acid:cation transporter
MTGKCGLQAAVMTMKDFKQFLALGLTLFALLFGAGNLIFPAIMGQSAGENVWWAVVGFCVTGVGLPLLSVAALGYSGCFDLEEAASRVHPWYGIFYSVVSYCAIGPCFAAPRTGTVSFEIAVRPFIDAASVDWVMPLFLLLFFAVAYWFSATPSKIVDRVGKVLAPALIIVILLLIVKSYFPPLGVPQSPDASYATAGAAVLQGFLEGYNTLDAIAAFIFATLIINFVRGSGVTDRGAITAAVIKSGVIAVAALAAIYFFIAKIGAESVQALGRADTGAAVLAGASDRLFGSIGTVILGLIVLLACLSTVIGLITCCAVYFERLVGVLGYKAWCALFSVISFLVGLFGLKTIIVATVPVLMFIYPLIISLVLLIFLDKSFGGRRCVYVCTTAATFVMALVDGLRTAGWLSDAVQSALTDLVPFYSVGMGWLPFAVVGFLIGIVWAKARPAAAA